MSIDEKQKAALDTIGKEVREAGDRIAAAWQRFASDLSRRMADRW